MKCSKKSIISLFLMLFTAFTQSPSFMQSPLFSYVIASINIYKSLRSRLPASTKTVKRNPGRKYNPGTSSTILVVLHHVLRSPVTRVYLKFKLGQYILLTTIIVLVIKWSSTPYFSLKNILWAPCSFSTRSLR